MIEPAAVRGIGIPNVAAIERRRGSNGYDASIGVTRRFGSVRSEGVGADSESRSAATVAHRSRAPPE